MKLVAAGRASEIFDLGDGRVLRRFLASGKSERESLVMEHARSSGYPVPRVLEVSAEALVFDRIDGPTMLAELRRRPWCCAVMPPCSPSCTSGCTRSTRRQA